MKRQRTAQVDYPPGHFTRPVRAWFGPHWQPASPPARTQGEVMAEHARKARADGKGWARGTVAGLSERSELLQAGRKTR